MKTTTTKRDRIDRAVEIIRAGNKILQVNYYENGGLVWFVESSNGLTNYRVTERECTCPDSPNGICKHRWAGPGAQAAMLIHRMRRTAGLLGLQETAELYAPLMAGVPEEFVCVARDEYRKAMARLIARVTFGNEVAA